MEGGKRRGRREGGRKEGREGEERRVIKGHCRYMHTQS